MIHFIFLFLNPLFNEAPLILEGTEIYTPLFSSNVAISSTGDFFIYSRQDKVILHYSKFGEAQENVGRQGQGPGEFSFPGKIYCFENKLYVVDFQATHIFNEDGTFSHKAMTPSGLLHFTKINGGWVGIRGLHPMKLNEPTSLIWLNDDLGQEKILATWSSEQERADGPIKPFERNTYNFNPARGFTHLSMDPERKTVIVSLSGHNKVFGFDMVSKMPKFEIDITGDRVPFDEENGKRLLEDFQARLASRGMTQKVLPDFPKYFPLIRGVYVSAFGQLVVGKWFHDSLSPRENRTEQDRNLYFDFDGESVEKQGDKEIEGRILFAGKKYFYLSCYLDTEEWSVARVPKEQAKTFIESHPLPSPEDM